MRAFVLAGMPGPALSFFACMLATMVASDDLLTSFVASFTLFTERLFSLKPEELAKLSSRWLLASLTEVLRGKTDEDLAWWIEINPLRPLAAGFLVDLPMNIVFLLLFCMNGSAGTFFCERLEPELLKLIWLLALDKNELKLLCLELKELADRNEESFEDAKSLSLSAPATPWEALG